MLDIKYRFTCGNSDLSEIIKKCQNIMTRNAGQTRLSCTVYLSVRARNFVFLVYLNKYQNCLHLHSLLLFLILKNHFCKHRIQHFVKYPRIPVFSGPYSGILYHVQVQLSLQYRLYLNSLSLFVFKFSINFA